MKEQRFIILPARGLVARASENPNVDFNVTNFLTRLTVQPKSVKRFSFETSRLKKPLPMTVLDSVHEDGAKLVSIDPENISNIHMAFPGLRLVKEVFFKKAVIEPKKIMSKAKKAATGKKIKFTVAGSDPVAGATVVVFTDFAQRIGAQGTTSATGIVTLTFPTNTKSFERIYVYPKNTYWTLLKKNVKANATNVDLGLTKIDTSFTDVLRYFYKNPTLPAVNNTIKIGVVDTGVGKHDLINLAGGQCTVPGEDAADNSDYEGHGTHVSGIISAFAKTAAGKPAIQIYGYRVFPKVGDGASNYAIVKAIDRAVADGCQLINMSLGGGEPDDATKEAITDAHSKGVVCFVAAGNDSRKPVSFPASFSLSVAVSAMGRKGTFPKDTDAADSVQAPFGTDKDNFIADFSNIGPEIDLTGPGVGIISCAPNNLFAVMSGTSMACPAATGIAARLLMDEGAIMNQPGNANRANSMIKLFNSKAKTLGFQPQFEGQGMVFR